jgi:SPP1 family predicted phage head-tail adaptor
MRAGELDRIIELQKVTTVQNSLGELEETWATYVMVPATKRPLKGQEKFMSAQTVGSAEVIFTVRYRGEIDDTYRLISEGDAYDITYIAERGRREGLDIYAKTRKD